MQQRNFYFEIKPHDSLIRFNFKELWRYRDLIRMFVRRNIVAQYKQTVLGPLWLFIQPVISSIVMLVVFNKIANLDVGEPAILFYLAGNTAWNFFATCLNSTANSFRGNAGIFGKVYFPRLASPLSTVISNLVKFCIQFLIFLSVYFYFFINGEVQLFSLSVAFMPVLIILMGGLGLGFGLIISALTTKYRDLSFFIGFGVQLMMYFTPVIMPLETYSKHMGDKIWIMKINPMTGIIETFRNIFIGNGQITWELIGYSSITMFTVLFLGIIIFNKTEKNFMDTV